MGQELVQRGVAVRLAHHQHRPRRRCARMDRFAPSLADAERAHALRGEIAGAQHRRVHHAENRRTVGLDQGDVHGEFAVALDELLGAVERVHQPVAAPAAARLVRNIGSFLRQAGVVRLQRRQPAADDAVCSQVRLGQRRVVVLLRHGEIGAVDVENGAARLLGDGQDLFEQRGERHERRRCEKGRALS